MRPIVWKFLLVGFSLQILPSAAAQQRSQRQTEDESPVFSVRDLLDERLLRGPGYVMEDQVRVHDYRYVFYLKTNYGRLPVHGIPMLELRLREMYAIAAARDLADQPQAIEGVVQTLANTPRGLASLLTEPDQAVRRAGVGFRRMADRATDDEARQAGGPVRRQLAAELGCDPETRNPILARVLDEVARRNGAGKFVTKTALSMAVPGLGLLAANAEQKESLRTHTPVEINASIEQSMIKLGVHPTFARRFRDEPSYTAMQRLMYWDQLARLRDIPGFESVVERAIEVDGEARALSTLEELRLLGHLAKSQGVERISLFELPVATLHGGKQVIVCAADYVTDTAETRAAVRAYRKQYTDVPTTLLVSGRESDAFRSTLADYDIAVTERPPMD
jgi:hypothetical protein